MRFETLGAPHLPPPNSVPQVMRQVLYALAPATIVYVWFFGWGLIFHFGIAIAVAIGSEMLVLKARGKSVGVFVRDSSAIVTAVLLVFAIPPLAPWWTTAIGTTFAIVFAKHLYGGLGYNPFNPAMAGYAVLLVSFPAEMTNWPPPRLAEFGMAPPGALETLIVIVTGKLPHGLTWDAVTMATPLDTVQTGLSQMRMMTEIRTDPAFGTLGGHGWQWVNVAFIAGGIWLLFKRVIRWQIPLSMLASLYLIAASFHLIDPESHPSATLHLFSGAAIIGAFFIATDPVSAATSNKGRLIYGAGIGVLTYVIRTWGSYPDGVSFAVLMMNMAVPTIDYFTRPKVYGHGRQSED